MIYQDNILQNAHCYQNNILRAFIVIKTITCVHFIFFTDSPATAAGKLCLSSPDGDLATE